MTPEHVEVLVRAGVRAHRQINVAVVVEVAGPELEGPGMRGSPMQARRRFRPHSPATPATGTGPGRSSRSRGRCSRRPVPHRRSGSAQASAPVRRRCPPCFPGGSGRRRSRRARRRGRHPVKVRGGDGQGRKCPGVHRGWKPVALPGTISRSGYPLAVFGTRTNATSGWPSFVTSATVSRLTFPPPVVSAAEARGPGLILLQAFGWPPV